MSRLEELLECILKELRDRRDEGKAMYFKGTLNITVIDPVTGALLPVPPASPVYTIIDFVDGTTTYVSSGNPPKVTSTIANVGGTPGHPIKGYFVKNTDTINNILVGHNIYRNVQADNDIIDATEPSPYVLELLPCEYESVNYNIQCIRSIVLLATIGNPTFKLKAVW